VKGGLSRITDSAADILGTKTILRNSRVTEIHEVEGGKVELVSEGLTVQRRTFDRVILTVPPVAIQNIRTRPLWSLEKERGIRTMHEGPLYKMGLHFRTRFWEHTSAPCFGGQTQTDLRIGWIVYPSNDLGSTQSGCLIVYSGMTDALRWCWTNPQERVRLALAGLDTFFRTIGIDVYEHFLDAFDVCWPSEVGGGNTSKQHPISDFRTTSYRLTKLL
jgi:monoamine oxidase